MAAPMEDVLFQTVSGKSCKIVNVKVKCKSFLSKGTLIASYKTVEEDGAGDVGSVVHKFKANVYGTVEDIFVKIGDVVSEGMPILKLSLCTHPTVMKDMCAECGADLRECDMDKSREASVAMVHSIPELQVSKEEALKLASQDEVRLLKNNKLTLVVDLDQTVIHTTMDDVAPDLPGVVHFQLWGSGPQKPWYHTKIRPGCKEFLEKMSKYYELHIFTMGARMYAHTIAAFLDPDKRFFSHRILSRDECFDQNSKTANLKSIFPCGDTMVCIIDDRDDVWNFAPNLVQVRPYKYFEGTGDINSPVGLPTNPNADAKSSTKSSNIELKAGTTEKSNDDPSADMKDDSEVDPKDDSKVDPKDDTRVQLKVDHKDESNVDTKDDSAEGDPMDDSKVELKVDPKDESKVDPKEESKTDLNVDVKPDLNEDSKVDPADVKESKDTEADQSEEITKDSNKTEDELIAQGSSKEQTSDSLKDSTKTDAADELEEGEVESASKEAANKKEGDEKDERTKNDKTKSDEDKEDCSDDYFLYLEDILIRIHAAYFKAHNQTSQDKDTNLTADLKDIVPKLRSSVLSGVHIVFSGVFPTNMPPEQSRAWKTAVALGAQVSAKIVPRDKSGNGPSNATTHLIAAKAGTNKVHSAQRYKKIHIVTADWLWCCQERWDRVDERMFLLPGIKSSSQGSSRGSTPPNSDSDVSSKRALQKKRKGSPDGSSKSKQKMKKLKLQSDSGIDDDTPGGSSDNGKLSGSGPRASLSSEYNPIYSFSSEDLASMDKEVEDIFQDSSSSDSDTDARSNQESLGSITQMISSSSDESLTGENPLGWSTKKRKRRDTDSDKEKGDESDSFSSPGVSDDPGSDGDADQMADAIDDLLTYSKMPTVAERLNMQR